MPNPTDSVRRFDDRVDDYVRHRPGYPAEVADLVAGRSRIERPAGDLARARDATRPMHIADIGCGTGRLAEPLLAAGHDVLGIEPNAVMRAAAAQAFAAHPRFTQLAGTAEHTGLDDASVDAITVGQAFHWFDVDGARDEFRRVLRPGGTVTLVWNSRTRRDGRACTRFLAEYEMLLRKHVDEYARLSSASHGLENVERFFGLGRLEPVCLGNPQHLDWPGFVGRVRSSSYVPREGPVFETLIAGLQQSFRMHAVDGLVDASLQTWVFRAVLR